MDQIPLPLQLGALAMLLLLSAFFSISETSLMSVNRYRLRHLAKSGQRGARLAVSLLNQTDKLLGMILLCNNLANAAAATLVTAISIHLFGSGEIVLMLATLAVTFAILVFSEISPKVFAAAHAERLAPLCSYLLYPLLKLLTPVVWFVNLFVQGLLRMLGIKVNFAERNQGVSMEELRSIVLEAGSYIPHKHRAILLNLFELEKITVDDVMTPHTQIESINLADPPEEILQQLTSSHHTRLPVKEGQNEEIIGILHLRKAMRLLRNGTLDLEELREIITDPYFIPSGTPLYTQMQQFQENRQRIALVVDEYGELKGLVSLEDILEEVIGDFTTQSPLHMNTYRQEADGSWIVDGSSHLRDLNKKLGLNFPLDGPRTMNGLVLEHFEDIPEPNTSFKIGSHRLEILQTHDRIVKSVRIYP
ncbi:MAG TPA: CNNM domain-containing protein [Methylophilaceae bacterium]